MYTNVKISRSAIPIFFPWLDSPKIHSCPCVRAVSCAYFGSEDGNGGSELAAGVGVGDG
jgi:hypothetical protein